MSATVSDDTAARCNGGLQQTATGPVLDESVVEQERCLQQVMQGEDCSLLECKAALQALLRRAREVGVPEEPLRQLLHKLLQPKLIVAVIALIKAGKSTMLNAFLGEEFLPSAAQPATATITHIVHTPSKPNGRLVVTGPDGAELAVHEGRKQIHEAICTANEVRRVDPSATPMSMLLEAPITAIGGMQDSNGVVIVDTPGPNEHGAGLGVEVQKVLYMTDVIFYMLDFTKLGSDDEARMFETLSEAVLPLLESSSNPVRRIYYVLNKTDCHSRRNDKELVEIQRDVAEKISKLLPDGTEVLADHILPISAANGILARQVLKHRDDAAFLEDFLRKAMGECFEDEVEPHQYAATARLKAAGLEKRSGLGQIEQKVLPMVVQQKHTISLLSVCDGLTKLLTDLFNQCSLELGTQQASLGDLQRAMEAMQRTRAVILGRLKALQKQCQQMKDDTFARAMVFFSLLKKDVKDTIDVCIGSNSDNSVMNPSYIKPFVSLVKALLCDVGKLEAPSREALNGKVRQANQKFSELLAAKMEKYRCDINVAMLEQQCKLQRTLEEAVQPLLDILTQEGGAALNVQLKTESLSLPHANFEEFEAETARKMEEFVREKREHVQKTRQEYRERTGICNSRYTEAYDVAYSEEETTGFRINKDDLKRAWLDNIEEQVEVSMTSTRLLIDHEVLQEVERIRIEVTNRCDAYTSTIQFGMEQKRKENAEKLQTTNQLKSKLQEMEDALDALKSVKSSLQSEATGDLAALLGFQCEAVRRWEE